MEQGFEHRQCLWSQWFYPWHRSTSTEEAEHLYNLAYVQAPFAICEFKSPYFDHSPLEEPQVLLLICGSELRSKPPVFNVILLLIRPKFELAAVSATHTDIL